MATSDRPRTSRGPRGRKRTQLTGEERRRRILGAAAEVFAETGFSGTTVRSIATASGITEAALYRYFDGKEALFEAALEAKIQEYDIEGFLGGLSPDLSLLETFQSIGRRILEVGLNDPVVHQLLLAASVGGTPETRSLYVSWRLPFIQHLERVVRQGIDKGEIRAVDPLLTARAFVGLVMDCVLSCNLWTRLGYDSYEPDQLISNNVPTFVRGLLARPAGPEEGKGT
jgi:AcrR family transcriptional regulator